jgi:hypothetical protein
MNKHKYNIFPEMRDEDYSKLKNDLKENGFDKKQPIYIYENQIIDGWNRQRACIELGIEPIYTKFEGSEIDVFKFIMRTNKRRNLTSSQWAAIAVESEDIVKAIKKKVEDERREKQIKNASNQYLEPSDNLLSEGSNEHETTAATQIASLFNTNRTYVNEAASIKVNDPDLFQEIKNGKKNITKAKKERKSKEKKEIQKKVDSILNEKGILISDIEKGWHKIGNQYLYFGNNTDKEFIDFVPPCKLAFADPPYNAGVDDWDFNFTWSQDYLQDKAEVVCVTPGGWDAYNFYNICKMNYQWEMACWIKNGMTHGRCGYANWIKIAVFGKGKVRISQDHFSISIKTNETEDTNHKGRKPYEFMAHLIEQFTKVNECIIDPFAGSGTTLIMSEKLNRISYCAELDKQYCLDIINKGIKNGMQYDKF